MFLLKFETRDLDLLSPPCYYSPESLGVLEEHNAIQCHVFPQHLKDELVWTMSLTGAYPERVSKNKNKKERAHERVAIVPRRTGRAAEGHLRLL